VHLHKIKNIDKQVSHLTVDLSEDLIVLFQLFFSKQLLCAFSCGFHIFEA